jgi:type II secretory pathway component PulF
MAMFAYKARDRAGKAAEGRIEAADRLDALRRIESAGLTPVTVKEGAAGPAAPRASRARRMSGRQMLIFTTELSDLLASGMTLGNALNCLARRQTGGGEQSVTAGLRDEIIRGAPLSAAMAQFPRTFPSLYINMIRAGEASGALAEVLVRLVEYYERLQDTREKVVTALVYPVIVLTMGMATLLFSMLFVVPKFEEIFEQMGQNLPLPTLILIGTSKWLLRYGAFLAVGLVVAAVLANRALATPAGALWRDRLLLRMPLLRGVVASSTYANFARTLATLLRNGVPALSALGIVEQTVGNRVIAVELRKARERVTDGTTLSGPLAAGKVLPPILTDMLAIGEQTGDMPGALTHIARRYENELNRNIKIFTTALEPILILLVAVMVGFVALSILLAVFSMTNGLDA